MLINQHILTKKPLIQNYNLDDEYDQKTNTNPQISSGIYSEWFCHKISEPIGSVKISWLIGENRFCQQQSQLLVSHEFKPCSIA